MFSFRNILSFDRDPKVGDIYGKHKKANPFAHETAEILEVKDEWVKYRDNRYNGTILAPYITSSSMSDFMFFWIRQR